MTKKRLFTLSWKKTFVLVGVFIIALFVVAEVSVYFLQGSSSKFAQKVIRTVPYPAVITSSGEIIWLKEILFSRDIIEKIYKSNDGEIIQRFGIDPHSQASDKLLALKQKEIINKQIENAVFVSLAQQYNQDLRQEEIEQNIDRAMQEQGVTGDLFTSLQKDYELNEDEIAQYIVAPMLYRDRAIRIFEAEIEQLPAYKDAYNKVMQAEKFLNDGRAFSEVAKEFSQDANAEKGGYVGETLLELLDPSIANALRGMRSGDISDTIESPLGFHIVQLHRIHQEGQREYYEISHILIRAPLFADWIAQEVGKRNMHLLLDGYTWNAQTGLVEFEHEDMRKFEQDTFDRMAQDDGGDSDTNE